MDIGMLWYSNDPKMTLISKIASGVAYYEEKYKRKANFVYMHPSNRGKEPINLSGITVAFHRSVMPNHFWIGVKEDV